MNELLTKFRGAIIGTSIGDALGAPMETMWAKDIAEKFPHFSADNLDYVASMTDDDRGMGCWTDDTQLMIPTIQSILKKGYIDPEDMANAYADVYSNQKRRGWGRSTTEALKRVAEGVPWYKAAEGSLGTGNGPPMKAAPLGLVLAAHMANNDIDSIKKALSAIVDVCKITHKTNGVRAGLLQSLLVALTVHDFSNAEIIEELGNAETHIFRSCALTNKVDMLISNCDSVAGICELGGVTSKAEESWCSTAAVFLQFGKLDPITSLVDIIRQGGDTDTTGAMLGALIGARFGELIFPRRLRDRLEDGENIAAMGTQLFNKLGLDSLRSYDKFVFYNQFVLNLAILCDK